MVIHSFEENQVPFIILYSLKTEHTSQTSAWQLNENISVDNWRESDRKKLHRKSIFLGTSDFIKVSASSNIYKIEFLSGEGIGGFKQLFKHYVSLHHK